MFEVKITTTLFDSAVLPTPVSRETLKMIANAIRDAVVRAVNAGTDAKVCILVHPHKFLIDSGSFLFLNDIEGVIIAASMRHIQILSDQGGRTISVEFVGGGTLFAISHAVGVFHETDAEDDADEEEEAVEEVAEEAVADDGSDGSSTASALVESDNNEPGPIIRRNSGSSSDGEEFIGLSQLTI